MKAGIDEALLLHRQGDLHEAVARYDRLLSQDPGSAELQHLRGLATHQLGLHEQALDFVETAVRLEPGAARHHSLRGSILATLQRWPEAVLAFRQCCNLDRLFPDASFNLGVAHHQCGQLELAAVAYREALDAGPDPAPANNLGLVLKHMGRLAEARGYFEKALQMDPNHVDASINLAAVHRESGRNEEALQAYEAHLTRHPDSAEAHFQAGLLHHQARRCSQAEQHYESAIRLAPHPEALNNLGLLVEERDAIHEAEECYRRASELKQGYTDAASNLGNLLLNTGRVEESLACYHQALRCKPSDAAVRFNRSMALLAAGQWIEGWAEYRWRWKWDGFSTPKPAFTQPWWHGEDIRGKALLIWCEQGIGDTLHFVRYARLVQERGIRTVLAAPRELHATLVGCPGVDLLVKPDELLPHFDYHVPLLDLPGIFGTTPDQVPATVPYLRLPPADVMPVAVPSMNQLSVGLIWAGGTHYPKDRWRSLRLEQLKPLLGVPAVAFHSLQVGPKRSELAALDPSIRVIDVGGRVKDFRETASAMCQLDLIISTCTSTLHLAGALGRPTWALLSHSPCWRWLRTGSSTPWYPTMRLFRQRTWGDWNSAIFEATEALQELARDRRTVRPGKF